MITLLKYKTDIMFIIRLKARVLHLNDIFSLSFVDVLASR